MRFPTALGKMLCCRTPRVLNPAARGAEFAAIHFTTRNPDFIITAEQQSQPLSELALRLNQETACRSRSGQRRASCSSEPEHSRSVPYTRARPTDRSSHLRQTRAADAPRCSSELNSQEGGAAMPPKRAAKPAPGAAAALACGNAACGKTLAPPLLQCSKCKAEAYCCKACQVGDPAAHRAPAARAPASAHSPAPSPRPPCLQPPAARPPRGRPGTSTCAVRLDRPRRRCSSGVPRRRVPRAQRPRARRRG